MKALILGYYGANNHGDDMMLLYLLRWMNMQEVKVTVISENVTDTRSRFGVDAVLNTTFLGQWSWFNSYFRGHAFRLARAIKGNDVLVVGGGDIIRDDKGWKIFWYTMEKIILAILLGKTVILVNVGIGRPTTKFNGFVLKWALNRCKKLIIRDKRSLALCGELGCEASVVLIDDIVFHLPDILKQAADKGGKSIKEREPYVIVSLRGNPNVGKRYSFIASEIENIAKSLDYLIEKHALNIVFVPFQKGVDDGDDAVVNTICNQMRYKDKATFCNWTNDLEEVLALYENACFVVAMRLHAAVLAVAYNKSCVLLPYDIKLDELAQQVGLKNLLNSDDLNNYEKVQAGMEVAINESPEYNLGPDILKDINIAECK